MVDSANFVQVSSLNASNAQVQVYALFAIYNIVVHLAQHAPADTQVLLLLQQFVQLALISIQTASPVTTQELA